MNTPELIAILEGTHSVRIPTLQMVGAHGFTCVFRDRPRGKNALPTGRKEVLQDVAARQSTLEACMQLGDVICVVPRTYIPVKDSARLVLANLQRLTKDADRLRDLVQFQISVSWDSSGVLARFRDRSQLAPVFAARTISSDFLDGRLNALKQALQHQMETMIDAVITHSTEQPLQDDMLFNTLCLLHKYDEPLLDSAVAQIDEIWPQGLKIRQIGPAPASAFAPLAFTHVSAGTLGAAYGMLSVKTASSTKDIEQAKRVALRNAPQHATQIRNAAQIVHAASRLDHPEAGFWLCGTTDNDARAQTDVYPEPASA